MQSLDLSRLFKILIIANLVYHCARFFQLVAFYYQIYCCGAILAYVLAFHDCFDIDGFLGIEVLYLHIDK